MVSENCPDRNLLAKVLLGDLPGDQLDIWSSHFANCPICEEAAKTIEAEDEITRCLNARRELDGEDSVVERIIQEGCDLLEQYSLNSAEFDSSVDDLHDYDTSFLSPPEMPDEIGRLGPYRVQEVIGSGGMGVVFRAEDTRLRRHVALKVIRSHLTSRRTNRQRLLNEAQSAAALDHDNIVQIYDVGEENGVPYIAMQLIRGESLRTRLTRVGRMTRQEVVRIGREIAQGLHCAHERKLIHRDIKPDNVWLEAGNDRVKLLDFGLVRSFQTDSNLTADGSVIGTPRYMSPEQAIGSPAIDHRADLFSLGCVLYEMACGRSAFKGDSTTATLLRVAQANFQPLLEVDATLNPQLTTVIEGLLSRKANKRPADAKSVVDAFTALESESSNLPVVQHRITWFKKHWQPRLATVLAVAILSFGLFAAFTLKFKTDNGTLVVRTSSDDFETTIQGKKVSVLNLRTQERYTITLNSVETQRNGLPPGEYEFLLETSTGLTTRSKRFEINSNDKVVLEVWWEPLAEESFSNESGKPIVWPDNAPAMAQVPFDSAAAKRIQNEWAEYLGIPAQFTNTIGMQFELIPPGEFQLGMADPNDPVQQERVHLARITRPFFLSKFETTDWDEAVIQTGIVSIDGLRTPATMNWHQAEVFCVRLKKLEPGTVYRMPTEAEWEFAHRAGREHSDREFALANGWFQENSDGRMQPVGQKPANAWGIFDTFGNAMEWCGDWYSVYPESDLRVDPRGPDTWANAHSDIEALGGVAHGPRRVMRGGAVDYSVDGTTSGTNDNRISVYQLASRYHGFDFKQYGTTGVRVLLEVPVDKLPEAKKKTDDR